MFAMFRHTSRVFSRMSTNSFRKLSTSKEKASDDGVMSLIPKKYWAVIIPSFVGLFSVSTVIYIEPWRDYLDEHHPGVTRFLREWIDLDDTARLMENSRVNTVLEEAAAEVQVLVTFDNGNSIIVESVDGNMPYTDFMEHLANTLTPNRVATGTGKIVNVEFLDSPSTEVVVNKNMLPELQAGGSRFELSQNTGSVQPAEVGSLSPFVRSLWDGPSASSPQAEPKDSVDLYSKFNRYVQYLSEGLAGCKARGSLDTHTLRIKPEVLKSRAKPSAKLDSSRRKFEAERAISELGEKIRALESEMRSGAGREIDVIQTEIGSLKRQQTELRRKHLNWFYYF